MLYLGQGNSVAGRCLHQPRRESTEVPVTDLQYTLPVPTAEEWRPIAGTADRYWVSSLGRVRGPKGNILKPAPNSHGYPRCVASPRGRCFVHILVAEAFIGPRPVGMVINHKDMDPSNPAANNLEYITRSQNILYSSVRGRPTGARGERSGAAKLSESAVREIRTSALPLRALARRFGVDHKTIRKAKSGETWQCVG
jgi:hypothetical protein